MTEHVSFQTGINRRPCTRILHALFCGCDGRRACQFCWGDLLVIVILIVILIRSSPIIGLIFGRLLMNALRGGTADQAHQHRDDRHPFPRGLQPKPQIESPPDKRPTSRDRSALSWMPSTLAKAFNSSARLRQSKIGIMIRITIRIRIRSHRHQQNCHAPKRVAGAERVSQQTRSMPKSQPCTRITSNSKFDNMRATRRPSRAHSQTNSPMSGFVCSGWRTISKPTFSAISVAFFRR